jgi:hypothetical protein
MSSFQWQAISGALVGVAFIQSTSAVARPQTPATQVNQPNRVSIEYVATEDLVLREFYRLLRERRALEKIQEMLSPFHLPEELTIKAAECGVVNSWYKRENFKPTVTICYEYLRHILESLPNATSPAGVTPDDATAGQFYWLTLHEVGHAIFDMFDVPIFGHPEDAADNFATYILLQFGRGQARRLIGGAAWAWRAYLGDYQRNPVVRKRIAAFADNHGLPEERFYNLLCLAFGADPVQFTDAGDYLPSTRSSNCEFEYRTLATAFHKEISPHIDQEMARRVLDTNWLPKTQS